MKKTLLLLLLILNIINSYSQKEQTVKNKIKTDSIKKMKIGTIGFSSENFNYLVNKNFSKLVTGQSTMGLGTYAAIDVKNTEATFSASKILPSGSIFNFNFKGGATDGVSSVFNNSKLNNNLSFELQYHSLHKRNIKIRYDLETLKKYQSDSLKIINDYNLEILKTDCLYDLNLILVETDKLKAQIEKDEHEVKTLTDSISLLKSDSEIKIIVHKIDSIKCKIAIDRLTLQQNLVTIKKYESGSNLLYKKLQLNNKKAKDINELQSKLDIIGAQFSWFSFSYKIRNDAFKLLDPGQSFANQVEKKNYVSHEFKTQLNFYDYDINHTIYWTTALSYKYKSNYLDLDKVEVTDTNVIGTSGNSTRETSKAYIAYTGDYKEGISEVDFDMDLYYLFLKNDILGFHIFPNSQFIQNQKPIHNLGFGLVVPFKDKNKSGSIVNAELYYNALNIFNTEGVNKNLLERNDIGFRFTFPFNF
jgi:hypothetical protein